MKILKREELSEFAFDEEVLEELIIQVRELETQGKDCSERSRTVMSFINKYNSLHTGVVAGLFEFVESQDPSEVEKIQNGEASIVGNWEQVIEIAPWALDCLKNVVEIKTLMAFIDNFSNDLNRLNQKTVGKFIIQGKIEGVLSLCAYFSFLPEAEIPYLVGKYKSRYYWLYQQELFSTIKELSIEDAQALILKIRNQEDRAIKRARTEINISNSKIVDNIRQPISDEIKIFVWRRDGGKCIKCHSQKNLEYDHIIPLVMGGSNTARNLQLLCEICNRAKGGNLI